MTVYADGDRTVRVACKAMDSFHSWRQGSGEREAGGILLGYVFDDHDSIAEISTPAKQDERSLFGFLRRKEPAQSIVNNRWKQSFGRLLYLGEWHTHCEDNPIPSKQDRRMIADVLRGTEMEIDHLYLVIVGRQGHLWVGRQEKKRLVELSLFDRTGESHI